MKPSSRSERKAGFTLIEVLIAVSLVGLLSLAMLISIRVGLNSEAKANTRLMENRRAMGAQRALEQELNGFIPEVALWVSPDGKGMQRVPFFGGDGQSMRFVSSYSLGDASRGLPQLLEFAAIPGDNGEGVRLIVNEWPYRGGFSAGERIAGFEADENKVMHTVFFPIVPGPHSFVLADRLAYCRMSYQDRVQQPFPHLEWRQDWVRKEWPVAVKVEMAPLDGDRTRLHPTTVTAPLHAMRDPNRKYTDEASDQ